MKNQKKLVVSYTSLIHGNQTVARFLNTSISKLSTQVSSAKRNGRDASELEEKLRYNRAQVHELDETRDRYLLAQAVCGDPCTIIR